eukprot:31184-Pelagococcus_subviridis.AAC.6
MEESKGVDVGDRNRGVGGEKRTPGDNKVLEELSSQRQRGRTGTSARWDAPRSSSCSRGIPRPRGTARGRCR